MITGQFRNIKDNIIEVSIRTNKNLTIGDNESSNRVAFGGNPLIINHTNTDFDPIKKATCKINLVCENYIGTDVFSSNYRSIPVEVRNITKNKVLFDGFLTPNSVSMGYSHNVETFTLNCVDYLSTLKYLNYKNIDKHTYEAAILNSSKIKFLDILKSIFPSHNVYYDGSKKLSENPNIFEELYINENIILGKSYKEVWKQEQVLKEILNYLSLNIIQEGNNFYIYNLKSIKLGHTNFINIFGSDSLNLKSGVITHNEENSAAADTQISISDVYNQISVKCDIQTEENIIENPLTKKNLISQFPKMLKYCTEIESDNLEMFIDAVVNSEHSRTYTSEALKITDVYFQPMDFSKSKWFRLIPNLNEDIQFENGKAYHAEKLPQSQNIRFTPMIYKWGTIEKNVDDKDNSLKTIGNIKETLIYSICGDGENRPSIKDLETQTPFLEYIGNSNIIAPNDDSVNYLVFSGKFMLTSIHDNMQSVSYYQEMKDAGKTQIRSMLEEYFKDAEGQTEHIKRVRRGENDDDQKYFVRRYYENFDTDSNNVRTLPNVFQFPPYTPCNKQFKYSGDTLKQQYVDKISKLGIILCELIIGDKRCVEVSPNVYKWIPINESIEVTIDGNTFQNKYFTLGFDPKIDDFFIGQSYDFSNNIDDNSNIGNIKGTAIPLTKDIQGKLEFRILGINDFSYNKLSYIHQTWFRSSRDTSSNIRVLPQVEALVIENFNLKIYNDGDGFRSQEEKNDLMYQSAENSEFIKNKEVNFKFITQLSGKEAYDRGMKPQIYINSVNGVTTPINGFSDTQSDLTMKGEEHFITDQYTEYNQPKLEISHTIKDDDISFNTLFVDPKFDNKTFYLKSQSKNVKRDTTKINLKEI